jgi:hypothetical protein
LVCYELLGGQEEDVCVVISGDREAKNKTELESLRARLAKLQEPPDHCKSTFDPIFIEDFIINSFLCFNFIPVQTHIANLNP